MKYYHRSFLSMKKTIIVLLFLLCNFIIVLTVSGTTSEPSALLSGSDENNQKTPEFVYYYPHMQTIREEADRIILCDTLLSMISGGNCPFDGFNEEQEECVPLPEGWSLYPCNGTAVLEAFPHLHISPGKKISGYYYLTFMMGVPVLSVFDTNETLTLPDEYKTDMYNKIPPSGDGEIFKYISGDNSPESYPEASVLRKMIPNHTSVLKRHTWSAHIILNDDMVATARNDTVSSQAVPSSDELKSPKWNWKGDYPERFDPVVIIRNDSVTVQFYTYSGLNNRIITRYTDTYPNGSYIPESEEITIASGEGGYFY